QTQDLVLREEHGGSTPSGRTGRQPIDDSTQGTLDGGAAIITGAATRPSSCPGGRRDRERAGWGSRRQPDAPRWRWMAAITAWGDAVRVNVATITWSLSRGCSRCRKVAIT